MRILKNPKFLLLIFSGILFLIFVSYASRSNKIPDTSDGNQSVESIAPGAKSSDLKRLGEPLSVTEIDDSTLYEYSSTSPTRNNKVEVKGDTVGRTIQIVSAFDSATADDLKEMYGNASIKLYNQDEPEWSFLLYVYPSQGIAYVGHQLDNTLLEIWRFEPTSIEEFIERWAPNYGLTRAPRGSGEILHVN